jgi:nucleoside-diphosphate-sugar epimerase
MTSTVVVTGACGCAGSSIVRRFAEADTRVVAVDICPPTALVDWFWRDRRDAIDFRAADIRGALPDEPVDVVVHAATATQSRPDEEIAHAAELIDINAEGTANVVAWAARMGARRIVVVSTATVYGHDQNGVTVTEDTVPRPETIYAIARLAGDDVALRLGDRFGIDVRVARLTYLYGPMERRTRFRTLLSPLHDWCMDAARGQALTVTDPGARMDYLHVTDAAEAIYGLAATEALAHRVYNVGPGAPTTLARAAELIADSTGCSIETRPGSPRRLRPPLAVSRLARDVGFAPAVNLERGLGTYVKWIRSVPRPALDELV